SAAALCFAALPRPPASRDPATVPAKGARSISRSTTVRPRLDRNSHCGHSTNSSASVSADSAISTRKAKLSSELVKRFARGPTPAAFYVCKTLLHSTDKITLLLGFQHELPQIVIHVETLRPGYLRAREL